MNSQRYNILELGDVILPACSLGLSSMGLHQEMKRLKLIQEMNCLKWLSDCVQQKLVSHFQWRSRKNARADTSRGWANTNQLPSFQTPICISFVWELIFVCWPHLLFCSTYPSNFAVIYRINWKSQSPVLSFLLWYDISANLFQMKALHSNLNK